MARYNVCLRGGFSDRNGIKCENTTVQITNFDHRTRIAIQNATDVILNRSDLRNRQDLVKQLMSEVYGSPISCNAEFPFYQARDAIFDTIQEGTYDDILTVLEYLFGLLGSNNPSFLYKGNRRKIREIYNLVFEQEYVGYRFVDDQIVPITDQAEIAAIEEALSTDRDEIKEHLQKSLRFLSDRESPDYENSIKESITSVECICSIILGKKGTLGETLKKLETAGIKIHGALQSAFEKLYGYTCDANGIRHSGDIGGPNATFEEAKFMISSCSAFINYLTALQAKCNSSK